MDWTQIVIEILIMLGAGGVGGAIVNGMFNRHKSKADAQKIQTEAEILADRQIIEGYSSLIEQMAKRIDRLDARITQLESQLKGRDMCIAELTEENRRLKTKVEELEKDRRQQIETNRRQGQLIADLRKRITELEIESKGDGAG